MMELEYQSLDKLAKAKIIKIAAKEFCPEMACKRYANVKTPRTVHWTINEKNKIIFRCNICNALTRVIDYDYLISQLKFGDMDECDVHFESMTYIDKSIIYEEYNGNDK